MRAYYALKRLSRSDLSFFRYHYSSDGSHQKSINLNADVFQGSMFPGLTKGTFHPVDLRVLGPVTAPEERLQRKIIRSPGSKNWRLDGEFIVDPEEVPDRYHRLADGDYALLKFEGDEGPRGVRCLLVSRADSPMRHAALESIAMRRNGGGSMWLLSPEDLEGLAPLFDSTDGPSLESLLNEASIERLELGAPETERLRHPRAQEGAVGAPVNREDADRVRRDLVEIGWRGEVLVQEMLDGMKSLGELDEFRWVSLDHAYAPHDFEVDGARGAGEYVVEVKTTRNRYTQPIFVSRAEAEELRALGDRYRLLRVYQLTEHGAKCCFVTGLNEAVAQALDALGKLPVGINVAGLTIDLRVLGVRGEERELAPPSPTPAVRDPT